MSCNAKITTANKPSVLTIPIQALVERDLPTEQTLYKNHGKEAEGTAAAAAKTTDTQGAYLLVRDGNRLRVRFVPVTTGVVGSTDIEVLGGLKPGDEIVTGRYKVLRTLKSGTAVKRDNSAINIDTDTSS